jgi:hypothetical protein
MLKILYLFIYLTSTLIKLQKSVKYDQNNKNIEIYIKNI